MTTLYEITDNLVALQQLREAEGEDMRQAIIDTLDSVSSELEKKAESIGYVLANFDSDVDAIDVEIKRLQDRKSLIKSRQDAIKDYLRENMERSGIKKIECPLFSITCAAGREVAQVDDESKLPEEYVKAKVSVTPDKNAIAKALKEGIEVPGACLVRSKSSIRIK